MEEYFRLLNDYYEKIYVLSVRSADHRRKQFEERFRGLKYSFFFGADKNDFTTKELIKKNKKQNEEKFKTIKYSFFIGTNKNDFTTKKKKKKNIYSEELTSKHHRYN